MRQTSKEAFETIQKNGLLSTRRWEVYEYLYHNGPCTGREVSAELKKQRMINGVYPRFSELRKLGVIAEVGERKDPETSMTVILWDVTDRLPKKQVAVKRKPKEFWLWEDNDEYEVYKDKSKAHEHRRLAGGKVIHVKQVLKKLKRI